jgi:hypothetical protein
LSLANIPTNDISAAKQLRSLTQNENH